MSNLKVTTTLFFMFAFAIALTMSCGDTPGGNDSADTHGGHDTGGASPVQPAPDTGHASTESAWNFDDALGVIKSTSAVADAADWETLLQFDIDMSLTNVPLPTLPEPPSAFDMPDLNDTTMTVQQLNAARMEAKRKQAEYDVQKEIIQKKIDAIQSTRRALALQMKFKQLRFALDIPDFDSGERLIESAADIAVTDGEKAKIELARKILENAKQAAEVRTAFETALQTARTAAERNQWKAAAAAFNDASAKAAGARDMNKLAELRDELIAAKREQERHDTFVKKLATFQKALTVEKDMNAAQAALAAAGSILSGDSEQTEFDDATAQLNKALETIRLKKFNALMADADAAIAEYDWDAAGNAIFEAEKIQSDETEKARIDAMRDKLKTATEDELRRNKFDALMADASTAIQSADFATARKILDQAIQLKSDDDESARLIALMETYDTTKREADRRARFQQLTGIVQTATENENWQRAAESLDELKTIQRGGKETQRVDDLSRAYTERKAEFDRKRRFEQWMTRARDAMRDQRYDDGLTAIDEALSIASTDEKTSAEALKQTIRDAKAETHRQAQFAQLVDLASSAIQTEAYPAADAALAKAEKIARLDEERTTLSALSQSLTAAKTETARRKRLAGLMDQASQSIEAKRFDDAASALDAIHDIVSGEDESAQAAKLQSALDAAVAEKKRRDRYDALVTAVDTALKNESPDAARTALDEARTLASGDDETDMLATLNDRLADLTKELARRAEFTQYMTAASNGMELNDIEAVEAAVTEAHRIASSEEEIAALSKIDTWLFETKQEIARVDKLNAFLKTARDAIAGEQWEQGETALTDARQIAKESEAETINELETTLADAKAESDRKKQFAQLVDKAHAAIAAGDFITADTLMKQAVTLKKNGAESDTLFQLRVTLADKRAEAERQAEFKTLTHDAKNDIDFGDFTGAIVSLRYAAERVTTAEENQIVTDLNAALNAAIADQHRRDYLIRLFQTARIALKSENPAPAENAIAEARQYAQTNEETRELDQLAADQHALTVELARRRKLADDIRAADAAIEQFSFDDAAKAIAEAKTITATNEEKDTLAELESRLIETKRQYIRLKKLRDLTQAIRAAIDEQRWQDGEAALTDARQIAKGEEFGKLDALQSELEEKKAEAFRLEKFARLTDLATSAIGAENFDAAQTAIAGLTELKKLPGDAAVIDGLTADLKAARIEKSRRETFQTHLAEAIAAIGEENFDVAQQAIDAAAKIMSGDKEIGRINDLQKSLKAAIEEKHRRERVAELFRIARTAIDEERADDAKTALDEAGAKLKTDEETTRFAGLERELDALQKELTRRARLADLIKTVNQGIDDLNFDVSDAALKEAKTLVKGDTESTLLSELEARLIREKKDAERRRQFNALLENATSAIRQERFNDVLPILDQADALSKKESEKARITEARAALKAAIAEAARREEFNKYLDDATALFEKKQYDPAIEKLDAAQAIVSGDAETARLNTLRTTIEDEQDRDRREKFTALTAACQTALDAGDIVAARKAWTAAKALTKTGPDQAQMKTLAGKVTKLEKELKRHALFNKLRKDATWLIRAKRWSEVENKIREMERLQATDDERAILDDLKRQREKGRKDYFNSKINDVARAIQRKDYKGAMRNLEVADKMVTNAEERQAVVAQTKKIYENTYAAFAHIREMKKHSRDVQAFDFSPDGKTLASASRDGTIILWNVVTGAMIHRLTGHTSWVQGVSFSPDGTRLASCSYDKKIIIWDAASGEKIRELTGHTDNVMSVDYSPDGRYLVSGSQDETAIIWDANDGTIVRRLAGHTGGVTCVTYSPDGSKIASGSRDKTIRIWNAETGDTISVLTGHTAFVNSIDYNPDGTILLSGGSDDAVIEWDMNTMAVRRKEKTDSPVRSVSFSPSGIVFATGENNRKATLWDANIMQRILIMIWHEGAVRAIRFSPDGKTVATGGADGLIVIWANPNDTSNPVVSQ